MSNGKRRFDGAFKLAAIARLAGGASVAALAVELGVRRELLHRWRLAYEAGGAAARALPLDPAAADVAPERRIAELERLVGQQQRDVDFFRAALRHVREQRRQSAGSGGGASTP